MPIPVACQCGATFQAKDALAGKRVKCPKCGSPLSIPRPASGPAPLEDLLDDVKVEETTAPHCPSCNAELKPGAVLCVNCGYDLKTGRKLKTAREGEDEDPAFAKLPKHGNEMLDWAEREIIRNKLQEKRMERGAPWWVYLIGVSFCVGFVAYTIRYKPDSVQMAIISFSAIAAFLFTALVFTITCNVYSSLEKKFNQRLKSTDELVAPAVGYSMAIIIAFLGAQVIIAGALAPAFGLRWWQGIKGKEDLPSGWGFYFLLGVSAYLTLTFTASRMIPLKLKRSALLILFFLLIMGAVGGIGYGGYLLFR